MTLKKIEILEIKNENLEQDIGAAKNIYRYKEEEGLVGELKTELEKERENTKIIEVENAELRAELAELRSTTDIANIKDEKSKTLQIEKI